MLNILVAFPYWGPEVDRQLSRLERSEYRLMIDSGAFTAWNLGRPISLDEYCRFLDAKENLRPFHAVQLDVFGDPEASWQNLLTMRSRGYDVMPVFTRGDSVDRLDRLYEHSEYIMFGALS